MTRRVGLLLCLLAAGCAASSRAGSRACAIDPAVAGTWTSTRATQMGPGMVNISFGCDCRYDSRVVVLGQTIDERGTYELIGGAIAFERKPGLVTSWPYRLEAGRLVLTEHPTETYTYQRVSAVSCEALPAAPLFEADQGIG